MRQPWTVIAGTIALGAVLVAGSFYVDGQWSALLLELGVGLGLVSIIFLLERHLSDQLEASERRIENAQDEKLADIEERLDAKIADAVRQAPAAAVANLRDGKESLYTAFLEEPTPANLVALADAATDMGLHRVVAAQVGEGWRVNIAPSQQHGKARVQITLTSELEKRGSNPLRVNWSVGELYADMLNRLVEVWAKSEHWPGQKGLDEFPHVLAEGYIREIRGRTEVGE